MEKFPLICALQSTRKLKKVENKFKKKKKRNIKGSNVVEIIFYLSKYLQL
jgi:hypothetical protein